MSWLDGVYEEGTGADTSRESEARFSGSDLPEQRGLAREGEYAMVSILSVLPCHIIRLMYCANFFVRQKVNALTVLPTSQLGTLDCVAMYH